ncbi:PRAME family member 8-like [Myotis yumanensis]|uniref:PRAME family member 8-like n=1 Tax=Myotis yumanensis TaxID=159337 RepID=UPI0038D49D64
MRIRTPHTLLELAAKRLLRDQASAIAALEYLPAELFPYLFVMAYRGRRRPPATEGMGPSLALHCPLSGGPDAASPDHASTRAVGLKAVFDALDVLLAQEVRPRRCKLRVLDLRNTGANFWDMWLGVSTKNCSPTGPVTVHSSSPNMEHPLAPLEVFLDLNFNERDQDKFSMHIIQWAQQREGLLHLCCKALRISGVPFQRVRRVLDRVQLDCIQEVNVNCTWDLTILGTFALYLGQMSNLQKLLLGELAEEDEEEGDEEQEKEGEEEEQQEEEQLKILYLYGLSLADFSEALRALLEAVAPTLQDLGLDNCGMADSQVEAILPVLSRCHQLRVFSICVNNFPVSTVEKLLCHTAGLHRLEVELYPVPLECPRTQGTVNQERLALIRAKLTGVLKELGQPRTIRLVTKHLRHRKYYELAFS